MKEESDVDSVFIYNVSMHTYTEQCLGAFKYVYFQKNYYICPKYFPLDL